MATVQIKSAATDNQALVDATGHLYVTSGGASGIVDTNLTEVGGSNITLGQKTSANSLPVVVASDQSAINVNLQGLIQFKTSQTTVGTSAVQLDASPLTTRSSVSIKAVTTTTSDIIYIGNSSGVISSTGYPLFGGDSVQIDITSAQAIWAIGSSAGQTAFLLEAGD